MKRAPTIFVVATLLAVVCLAAMPAVAAEQPDGPMGFKMLLEVESPLGFEETLERIETNAKALGWKVPSKWKVDFRNNMQKITDTDIGPNQVLKMCEPFAAAKLLVKDEYRRNRLRARAGAGNTDCRPDL